MMPLTYLIILVLLYFTATAVGVVTGGNSLITVPVMFQMGIDPKTAIATNMFGLTFMAAGATIPFYRRGMIDPKGLLPLVLLTLAGSAIGAVLVGYAKTEWIPVIVSISMLVVATFTLLRKEAGVKSGTEPKQIAKYLTLSLGFLLAVYGGFYSGGYITVMTAVLVAFYGMTFSQAIAGTKFLNLFSSLIATLVFMWQGLVDYSLGAILAVTMFAAAYFGARTVTRLNEIWLKRIFLSSVFLLALLMLLF